MTEKILLKDVVIIRPIAVILIVVWHTFIIYQGGWRQPANYTAIDAYWWVAKFSIIFSLELFTFISGYVLAYQNTSNPKSFGDFIYGKTKRLMIPSFVFSSLWVVLMIGVNNVYNWPNTIIYIICGYAHLWFLPMLYVVFCLAYFIVQLNERIVWLLLFILFSIAIVILSATIPFNISEILYYLPFFLTGYYFFCHKQMIDNKLIEKRVVFLMATVFFFTFIISSIAKRDIDNCVSNYGQFTNLVKILVKTIHLVAAFTGVVTIYGLSNLYVRWHNRLSSFIVNSNKYCFGIYLFQQFIIQIIYYNTSLFEILGSFYAPWITLIITLVFSYFLTYLIRLTKIGRFIIG